MRLPPVVPQRRRSWIAAEHGGVALEFAIVSMALMLVALGVIEFGRALSVRNELHFLADLAARRILTDSAVPDEEVDDQVRTAFTGARPELLDVELGSETIDGTEFRTVSISYPIRLLIPQLARNAITLSVEERVPVT